MRYDEWEWLHYGNHESQYASNKSKKDIFAEEVKRKDKIEEKK